MKVCIKLVKPLVVIAGLMGFLLPLNTHAHGWGSQKAKDIVAYFISWGIYGRAYTVKSMVDNGSADKVTVINYAFGNLVPNADGQVECQLGDPWAEYQKPWTAEQSITGEEVTWPNPVLGNFQQLKALKELYPDVKILISLGGWTWSKHFSDASLTAGSRAALAKSCIDLFIKGDLPDPGWGGMGGPGSAAGIFDGIDIDWEWPGTGGHEDTVFRPEDKQNYTKLLAEFRNQMDAVDPELLLTIVTPANIRDLNEMELRKIAKIVDFVNMIGYDFHVASQATTNHHANISKPKAKNKADLPDDFDDFWLTKAVKQHLKAGMPRAKLNVGAPFYGRGWTGVNPDNHGLYQNATGPAPATYEAGVEDYKVLKNLQASGFERYWDWKAKAVWLFDGNTFWSYDDPVSMCLKAKYVKLSGLRGMMFWELSGDDDQGELISAMDNCLHSWWWQRGHDE